VLKKYLLPWIGIAFISTAANATSPYGINFSYLVVNKDPSNLSGYRAGFLYEPPTWVWEHVHIFFDISYGHWWVSNTNTYSNLSIYSIAPVLRYYFINSDVISPFFDLSIGPSYLTKTRLSDRNLGIHFAFQDQIGMGASFGRAKHLTASFSVMHYSNGSMSAMNAGITVPLMLNVSYRF
jgi:hypothetical protein